jgi:hypothetical protein
MCDSPEVENRSTQSAEHRMAVSFYGSDGVKHYQGGDRHAADYQHQYLQRRHHDLRRYIADWQWRDDWLHCGQHTNNAALVFNRSDDQVFGGDI